MTDASADSMPLMAVSTGLFHPADAPGGPSEAVRGSMKRHLAAPGHRVSGHANEPMPSPPFAPRDSDALVACVGLLALADGAKVEYELGETATGPEATRIRVV
jgi:hypothetical protein